MLHLEHPSVWSYTTILFLFARRRQHIPRAPFHSPVQISALILCPLGCAKTSLSSPASLHGHVGAAAADLAVNCTDGSRCSTLALTWGNQGCLQSTATTARQNSPESAPLLICSGFGGPHTTRVLLRAHCQQPQASFSHLHQQKVRADCKGRQKIRGSVASWAINKHLH